MCNVSLLTADHGTAPKRPEDFTDTALAELSTEFERLPASKIIQWAVDNFAPHLALTASMTDAVLIDLAVQVYPAIEVVFIDTGYHFPETLETVERVRRHYGLNLRMMTVRNFSGRRLMASHTRRLCSTDRPVQSSGR